VVPQSPLPAAITAAPSRQLSVVFGLGNSPGVFPLLPLKRTPVRLRNSGGEQKRDPSTEGGGGGEEAGGEKEVGVGGKKDWRARGGKPTFEGWRTIPCWFESSLDRTKFPVKTSSGRLRVARNSCYYFRMAPQLTEIEVSVLGD